MTSENNVVVHPGTLLAEDFGISASDLEDMLDIPLEDCQAILDGKMSILGHETLLETMTEASETYWLSVQHNYDQYVILSAKLDG
jgi:plasmid maintenance system antidote protein VapI